MIKNYEEARAIFEMRESFTDQQIADILDLTRDQVRGRLRRMNAKALRLIAPFTVRAEKPKPIRLSLAAAVEIVESYFGRPIHISSASMFARDRIVRGVAMEIVRKYCRVPVYKMAETFCIGRKFAHDDIKFAALRAKDHIEFLTNQITAQHEQGTE